jgi:hypothetical protein
MKWTRERDKGHANRRVHEVGDQAARQCDFSNRSAHRSAQGFRNKQIRKFWQAASAARQNLI